MTDPRVSPAGDRREHTVPCLECRCATWNIDARCDACRQDEGETTSPLDNSGRSGYHGLMATTTTTPTTKRLGATANYKTAVFVDGQQIATTHVVRCTARTQFYGVTMSNGSVLPGEFASVKKAALAAAEAETAR